MASNAAPPTLLIATNNPGKVREYQEILQGLLPGAALLTLREAGIDFEVEGARWGRFKEAQEMVGLAGHRSIGGVRLDLQCDGP